MVEQEAITLDDIDTIEMNLTLIQKISANGLKSLVENVELERQGRITTAGYHLQLEIGDKINNIRVILDRLAKVGVVPFHREDMDKAAHIRELKDNIKVVDYTG
jgi:hypothetical protein